MTVAELAAGALAGLPACLVVTAYLVDTAGWPIAPSAMAILLSLEVAGAIALISRQVRSGRLKIRFQPAELAGFALIVCALCGYVLWLAAPSMLPVEQSVDVTGHGVLTDFIYWHHSLPHSPMLTAYLGEYLPYYSPGSHILAAETASWFGISGLRALHPVLAVMVAAKAGIVYNAALRLVPDSRRRPLIALAGGVFPLFAATHFFGSFMASFFYAQVAAETFAVAMLWALVAWDQDRAGSYLVLFTLCGVAVFLTWPLYLPIPIAALFTVVLLRGDLSLVQRLRHLVYFAGPVFAVAALYIATRLQGAKALDLGGIVDKPLFIFTEWPFTALAGLGTIVSFSSKSSRAVLWFGGGVLGQIAALFIYEAYRHEPSYYFVFKMFYLIVYPMALLAAVGVDALCDGFERGLSETSVSRWQAASLLLPALIVWGAVLHLPARPVKGSTVISEPLYECGLWAKSRLPVACVDYLVSNWVTAYWLHLQVLGNPAAASRVEEIINHFNPGKWRDSAGLPYALVGDLSDLPPDIIASSELVHRCGNAGIIRRLGASLCDDSAVVPLERVQLPARRGTLARLVGSLLGLRRRD